MKWSDCPSALVHCKPYILAVIPRGIEVKTVQLMEPIQVGAPITCDLRVYIFYYMLIGLVVIRVRSIFIIQAPASDPII